MTSRYPIRRGGVSELVEGIRAGRSPPHWLSVQYPSDRIGISGIIPDAESVVWQCLYKKNVYAVLNQSVKTEFLSGTVQGQCAPGAIVTFGGETTGVLAPAPVVGTTTAVAMNQLGTVYATKRRRRNGKRLVFKLAGYYKVRV